MRVERRGANWVRWDCTKLEFLFVLLFCLLNNSITNAFNIDTKKPQIHRRPNTGFGYSVDFVYRTQKREKFTLLVGAPFAQSSQRGLRNAGAVYGCETDQNTCAEIFFDREQGNELRLNGSALLPIEEKSYQMFGATVVASKNADAVLACAPHYKYFFSKFEVVEPVGTCFYAQNYFTKIEEFAPCRQEPIRHGHHRFGYGMCGFSAAVPGVGDKRLFISGPGVWYWQGAIFSQNVNNITDRPNTSDGPAHTDHHQLGYSTAAGDFDGDGTDDVVVGVPRGNELIGMVSIYTEKLKPIVNLTVANGQRGQYFGASVAVADLNKDGLMDLIVGSPFFTDYQSVRDVKTQERKPRYDIGKVYVYIQTAATFKDPIELIGHGQWGRFGHAVAAAGDLNGDGFEDFLVGAPFDGEEDRGVVYAYHGSEEGVRTEYTQKIQGKDLHKDMKTFGFSIRGGRDIDRNDYPDIAVGAFESHQAVILRTKPVMQITGSIKSAHKTINLDEKLCTTEFGRMSCEKLKFCLKFIGQLQPIYNSVDVKIKIHLDAKKGQNPNPRAFISRKDLDRKRGVKIDPTSVSKEQPDKIEQIITLTKGREYCESYDVYVPDTIRDKISPIVIAVNYSYMERPAHGNDLEPAVDTTLPQSFETELTIEKDCGDDNVCIPDLKIFAQKPTQNFTLGTDQTLTMNVTVKNHGEDSYLTQYYVTIPPGFEYGGIENYETKHKVTCSPVDPSSKKRDEPYEFVCDIGNPLPANSRADFGFKISSSEDLDLAAQENVEVKMSVNSTIAEEQGKESDNTFVWSIPIEAKAQLYLAGKSNPEQIDYSIRNRTQGTAAVFDFEIGPVVSHLFQVRNQGPAAINGAILDIIWPSFSDNGKHLLYLIDMPYVKENPTKAKCRINQGQNVNPASLAISGDHINAAPSKSISSKKTTTTTDSNGQNYDEFHEEITLNPHHENDYEENVRDPINQGDEYEEVDEEEEEEMYLRKKRAVQRTEKDAVKRRLRLQQQELKDTVTRAKDAGGSIEYHGQISRSTLNCHSLNCTHITCDIARLEADEYVVVEIFSRLWLNTLIDDNLLDISSLAFAQITQISTKNKKSSPVKYTPPAQAVAVTTEMNPTDPEQFSSNLPWWLYLLAILIALLILSLIICCCWRFGFFKRNRPHMEKAQLSKTQAPNNGDYYADNGARYAQPHSYSQDRHGVKV